MDLVSGIPLPQMISAKINGDVDFPLHFSFRNTP